MPRRSISRPTTLFGWHTRSVEPDIRDGPDGATRSGRPAPLRERWALTPPIPVPPRVAGLLERAATQVTATGTLAEADAATAAAEAVAVVEAAAEETSA
jgi:hypothetical protein